ncbi:MAG TPA: tetratricopeptide repeat protein, partial [Chloroflexota bacterium]|nr:tetratricopeptide repeat protein [Chloroflexota bacterium]
YDDATRSFGAGITQDPSLARGYTLLGKMSAKQSRWTDAIKLYQQALSTSAAGAPPRLGSTRAVLPRVKPHFLTAVADGHLHKPADAVAAVNAGLAINHSLARGHDILGRLYAGQNNGSAAMAEYQTAQKIQPTKGRPVALQGLLKSKNGDLAGAEALLRQAIGIEDKGRSHALLGKVYYADKKADAATTEYHRAIQLDPTKDRAYLLLARVSAAKKDWAGAQAIVTEALQKGPPKAQPHVAMGHLKMEQKQLDGAIGEFEQAIQLGPGRARPHNALGHVYAKQKQNDDAIAQYAMSLNLRSDKPRAHFATGRLYSKQGKPRIDDAIAQFQQAAKLKLNTGRFHVLLGKQYWRTGLRDQATAEFATALKMIPTKVRPYLMTGHLLATERQYGPSAQMFGKAFQLQPNKARPHNLMGLLYVAQQQTDLARKEYQAAAKIAPTKARALMLLGHLDASLKDPPQHDGVFAAIADYQQAIARNPNKANAYASIGRIYQRMTKLDEAYTPLTKAIQIKPGLAMAHYRLALVLEGYQRWSDAEREWETYLELQPRGGHSLDARIHLAKLLGMPYQLTPHQTKVQSRGKH